MKTIRIAGKEIKVIVKELEDKHGEADLDAGIIYLHHGADVPTELHERMHHVLHITGMAEMLGARKVEAVCRAIELLAPYVILTYEEPKQ